MYKSKLLESKGLRDSIISSLRRTLFEKSHETEEHTFRLRELALQIGHALRLPDSDLDELALLATLHDIGKIAISRKILNKLGKLTEAEFEIMKRHSSIAIRILEKVDGLQDSAHLVRHHHERFDGKGYPDGLAGHDIPFGSRIIAVAEAFDILTSDVPWRDALDQETALAEIEACSGTQFDPVIVSAFRTALTNGMVER